MKEYLQLLRLVLNEGELRDDRTGIGTKSVFGAQVRYDLSKGFPLLTTKEMNFSAIVHELLWNLKGDTNIKYLNEHGIHLWDPWADKKGDLGRIYGAQWREWQTTEGKPIDQIKDVIEQIKSDPNSRRLVVTAWNPADTDGMAIPNCCSIFQFYVHKGKLSCHLYQRSADLFLGVPYDIAMYSLLTMMIAQVCGLAPGEFIHSFGDLHIYKTHIEQAKTQIKRIPKRMPIVKLNSDVIDIDDFKFEDFTLMGYNPHPHIYAQVAI